MARRGLLKAERSAAEISERDRSHHAARSAQPLTLRQVQVLRCIEHFVAVHGFPPAIRDIALMLDVSSLAAVVDHLRLLEKKGYIVREANERRAIRVVVASDAAVLAEPRPLAKSQVCGHCRVRRIA